ncbi:MAG: hypothetical protein KAY09_07120 [Nitrospira sp.]|nr:hypothetical protein [Nitrospira sp.]
MIRPVVQEEQTGCGIAAAAALAGVSYSRAKTVAASLGISAQDPKLWSETASVRRLLRQFGLRVARETEPFCSWTGLPDCALLAIKWHLEQGRPFWHWVVFVRENGRSYVVDSNPTLKAPLRTDFGRMRPVRFLSVTMKR